MNSIGTLEYDVLMFKTQMENVVTKSELTNVEQRVVLCAPMTMLIDLSKKCEDQLALKSDLNQTNLICKQLKLNMKDFAIYTETQKQIKAIEEAFKQQIDSKLPSLTFSKTIK